MYQTKNPIFTAHQLLKNFAEINFRESTFSRLKKGIYFREFGQNSRNFLPAKISSLKVDFSSYQKNWSTLPLKKGGCILWVLFPANKLISWNFLRKFFQKIFFFKKRRHLLVNMALFYLNQFSHVEIPWVNFVEEVAGQKHNVNLKF